MDSAPALCPESALARLYRRYDGLVRWVARAAGVPESALDDLVHDVFLAIHRRLDDRDPEVPVRQWIAGVARNVAFSQRRARARELMRVQQLAPPNEPARPDEILAGREAWRALLDFLDLLSPEQREVFVMVEVTGMRVSELAATTGEPVNTLHSRLRLARARFGRHFVGDDAARMRALQRAKAQARPREDRRRRTWGLVVASVGGPSRLAPAAVLATGHALRTGWAWLWAWPGKVAGTLAVVGSLGAVAAMAESGEPATRAPAGAPTTSTPAAIEATRPVETPATADHIEAVAPVETPATADHVEGTADLISSTPSRPRLATATPPHAPPPAEPPTTEDDDDAAMAAALQALARARRDLAAGHPDAALTTLDAAAARHAPLDRDRQRLVRSAACALGRTERAREAHRVLGDPGPACDSPPR